MSSTSDNRSWSEWFSDMKKLILEAFGTPLWISDLSAMADEVRDRIILVKIDSQMHSVSNLGINYVFSEIGLVEDVRSLPVESGFHSLVRFRTKYDRDWAYHFYNGKILHQGCCELEIHRPNDIIRWNEQRVAEIKAAYVDNDSPVVTSDDHLLEEKLKNGEVLPQIEELAEIMIKDEPNGGKESLDLVAPQMFDEMPDLENCIEHKLGVALSKDNDVVIQDEFDPKAPILMMTRKQDNSDVVDLDEHKDDILSVSSNEDRGNLKALEIDELKDMAPSFDLVGGAYMPRADLHLSRYENLSNYLVHQLGKIVAEVHFLNDATSLLLVKSEFTNMFKLLNDFTAQEKMMNDYTRIVCFDPGGELILVGDFLNVKFAPPKKNQYVESVQVVKESCLATLIFDPGEDNLKHATRTVVIMVESSGYLEASLLGPRVLNYLENEKLMGSIGGSKFGSQQLIFDPGITFEQDYLKALEVSDLMGSLMSSGEEQDNLKASEVYKFNDMTLMLTENKPIDLVKLLNDILVVMSMKNDYTRVMCFDPGGESLSHNGDLLNLNNVLQGKSSLWCTEEKLGGTTNMLGFSLFREEFLLVTSMRIIASLLAYTSWNDPYFSWSTERRSEDAEFTVKNGNEDSLTSFHPIKGQTLETEAIDSLEILIFDLGRKEFMLGDLVFYLANESELGHSFLSRLKNICKLLLNVADIELPLASSCNVHLVGVLILLMQRKIPLLPSIVKVALSFVESYGNEAQKYETKSSVKVFIALFIHFEFVVTDMVSIKLSDHELHFYCKKNVAEMEFLKNFGWRHNLQFLGCLTRYDVELASFVESVWAAMILGEKLLYGWPIEELSFSTYGFCAQHLASHSMGERKYIVALHWAIYHCMNATICYAELLLVNPTFDLITKDLDLGTLEKLYSHFVAAEFAHPTAASNTTFEHKTERSQEDHVRCLLFSGGGEHFNIFATSSNTANVAQYIVFDLLKASNVAKAQGSMVQLNTQGH